MTDLTALSRRAQQALDVLKTGGRFVQRLERNSYTGREQFEYRLLKDRSVGSVVRGVGFKTFCEVGHLLSRCDGGTSVSTYYCLSA